MEDEGCRDIVWIVVGVINYLYYDGRLGKREKEKDRIIGNVTVHRHREGLISPFWGLDAYASTGGDRRY